MIHVSPSVTEAGGIGWSGGQMGPAMMGGGAGWPFMILHLAIVALILALIVAGLVTLVRYLRGPSALSDAKPDALAILDARYARGEIDHEEYEARRQRLTTRKG